MQLTLPARRESLEPARVAVLDLLHPLHASDRLVFQLELVLEEVLMNIVMHAYPEGQEQGMSVSVEPGPEAVTLCFEDAGVPFDPTQAALPEAPQDIASAKVGGLGVGLVRKFARSVHYERVGDRNRLRVALAR